ncbi:chloride channel protein [Humibacillus xanthopallidus]|uniref:chloride channel protein n=1 Tax=Humibacillus xanthopallidus TaxID=412689 RepID=UPI00384B1A39
MSEATVPDSGWRATGPYAAGAALGGIVGAGVVVTVTTIIKELLAVVSRQDTWVIIIVPVLGIAAATFVLHVIGRGDPVQTLPVPPPTSPASSRTGSRAGVGSRTGAPGGTGPRRRWVRYLPRIPLSWRRFPADVARADLTADVVLSAGAEERFPWRQAPLRALAIIITVGSGAPMGTEAPAAHLGVATGSWLGQLRPGRQQLLRGAAVAGGAAGVSALMGVALVGTAFILELGRRRQVALTPARVTAALIGGLIGWGVNLTFELDLIRLITPMVAPDGWLQVLRTCLYVGVIAGFLTALTGWAIYRVRGWKAGPMRRLVIGAGAMLAATLTLLLVADGRSAVGPGGGAILWAESPVGLAAPAGLLLLVAALRAAATTAAVAAGGCGGVFVPFLAIGDLAGRSFAPHLGIPGDLAGASGAASGIAGGYRLPWTAVAMVIGIGGPALAMTTSLGCVLVATATGVATSLGLDRLTRARADRRDDEPAAVTSS